MTFAGSMFATPPGLWGRVIATKSNPAGIAAAFSLYALRNFSIGSKLNPGPPVSSARTTKPDRFVSLSLRLIRAMTHLQHQSGPAATKQDGREQQNTKSAAGIATPIVALNYDEICVLCFRGTILPAKDLVAR